MSFIGFPKEGWTFAAYKEVLVNDYLAINGIPSILRGLFNTLWISVPPLIVSLFVSGLAAYAYGKLHFRAKKVMYAVQISTMMLPMSVMSIPSYLSYDIIGWTNSPLPLIIPGLFGGAAMIFFLRQFFASVPDDLIAAAKLDGLGYFGIYIKIIVPIVIPAFVAQGIFGFVGGYNNYTGPLLYLTDPEQYTLQIVINSFASGYPFDFPILCASALLALLPLIIIYIACQKFFVEGIGATGLKG
jgi:multiple sugar transport system permease protein